jgi:hypothetical protein
MSGDNREKEKKSRAEAQSAQSRERVNFREELGEAGLTAR